MAQKPLILIIDDEPDIVNMLKMRIEAVKGYRVITAGNGVEGLERLEEHTPNLIILDVMMPEMDGLEFYDHIVDDEGFPKYPVLVLTAAGHLEELFLQMNANGFISKPFKNEELLEEIDLILKHARKRKRKEDKIGVATWDGIPTVAVIENDEEKYLAIAKAMKKEGYHITNSHRGLSAIGELLTKRPDVILIKLGLKSLRGDILMVKLKRLARLADIPMKIYVDDTFEFDSEVGQHLCSIAGIDNILESDETFDLVRAVKICLEERK